jgi:phosphate transport system permease protein
MAIIMVSGNAVNMPTLFKSVRFLTTAIALEISYASGVHRSVLMSCGLVLFILIFALNFIFMKIFKNKK